MPSPKRPRRAAGAERRRDPERTQERILDAALEEFAAHGYAGARVSRIAKAAEANAQLISYYFDGKAGLYRAVAERRRALAEAIPQADAPIADIAAGFVAAQPSFARLLVWEALGDGPEANAQDEERQAQSAAYYRSIVADLERRQAAGELPADVAAPHLLVALIAIASAPVTLPQLTRLITGEDPDSPAFLTAYAEQVKRLVAGLAR